MDLAAASVTRSIALGASADAVWASLRDADGLTGWLGDEIDLGAVAPGAAGSVAEGGAVRRLVVTEVDEGRSIGFAWWDETNPAEVSTVTIALAPGTDHTTTVTVTERLAGAATASIGAASVRDLAAAEGEAWDRRLQALVGEWTPSALSAASV